MPGTILLDDLRNSVQDQLGDYARGLVTSAQQAVQPITSLADQGPDPQQILQELQQHAQQHAQQAATAAQPAVQVLGGAQQSAGDVLQLLQQHASNLTSDVGQQLQNHVASLTQGAQNAVQSLGAPPPTQPPVQPPADLGAPPDRSMSLQDYARAAAQRAGIDPNVFTAQIQQESGFNPAARSNAGAIGVAQFMPETAKGVGLDPTDPYASLDAAAREDAKRLQQYQGDWGKTLASYNAGAGAVDTYGGIPPYAETQTYVKTIMDNAQQAAQAAGTTISNAVGGAASALGGAARGALDTASTAMNQSQFNDPQLTADESYAACGPAAAVRFAERFGRNPTLREATDLAKQVGWTSGGGMAGITSEQRLLKNMGVDTHIVAPDWDAIAKEAQTGNPVTISTPQHYFFADGYNPQTGAFHVGRSGLDLVNGSEWMTPTQMENLMGRAQGALFADNPAVPASSTAPSSLGGTGGASNAPITIGGPAPVKAPLYVKGAMQDANGNVAADQGPTPIQSAADVLGGAAGAVGEAVGGAASALGSAAQGALAQATAPVQLQPGQVSARDQVNQVASDVQQAAQGVLGAAQDANRQTPGTSAVNAVAPVLGAAASDLGTTARGAVDAAAPVLGAAASDLGSQAEAFARSPVGQRLLQAAAENAQDGPSLIPAGTMSLYRDVMQVKNDWLEQNNPLNNLPGARPEPGHEGDITPGGLIAGLTTGIAQQFTDPLMLALLGPTSGVAEAGTGALSGAVSRIVGPQLAERLSPGAVSALGTIAQKFSQGAIVGGLQNAMFEAEKKTSTPESVGQALVVGAGLGGVIDVGAAGVAQVVRRLGQVLLDNAPQITEALRSSRLPAETNVNNALGGVPEMIARARGEASSTPVTEASAAGVRASLQPGDTVSVRVPGRVAERAATVLSTTDRGDAFVHTEDGEDHLVRSANITPIGEAAVRTTAAEMVARARGEAGPAAEQAGAAGFRAPDVATPEVAQVSGARAATTDVTSQMQRNFLRDTVRAPNSDPRPKVQDIGLPNEKLVHQNDLTDVVPAGTTVLYHETSVPNARALLDRIESGPRNQTPIFTSDNRDLALGQGGKGVMLEFDPARANGSVAPQKPGLTFTSATGGGQEYTVSRTLPGAVSAIVVRTERQAAQLATNARVARRFDFANAEPTADGGIRIPRRETGTALPAAAAVVTPRVAPEPTGFRAPETGATSEAPTAAASEAFAGARAAPGEAVTATTPTARVTARVGEPPVPPLPPERPPAPPAGPPPPPPMAPTGAQGPELAGNIRLPKFVQQPVADIIQQVHDADPARFEAARRGVVTDQMVRDLADEAGTTVNRVAAAWKPGKAANAETTLALRTALADRALRVRSAQNLLRLNPASIDARNTLVEALNQHAALQEVVAGVTGEAGRVVRQFRQPVTGEQASLSALQRMAKNARMSPEELAGHLTNVDLSDPQAVASLASTLTTHSFADKAQALWYFNLLSSPVTWMKNGISNALVLASRPIESLAAAGIDAGRAGLTGTDRQRFMGEAPAEIFGMAHGLGPGLQDAFRAMRTGITRRELENPELAGRMEPFSGRLADLTVNVPGRVLSATDALFRTMNEQASIYKLAYRQAAQEGTSVSGMTDRIAEILRNPDQRLLDEAKAEGAYRIFQNPNAVGKAALQVREALPFGTGRFLMPFVNTPVNVGAYALERSPLAAAKLVGSAAERSGGQLSDNIARMTLGTALAGFAALQGAQGNITGAAPTDPTERDAWEREGKQPYSIHAPNGVWYSYGAMQPFSTLIAAGAAAGDAWKKGQNDPTTGLNPASLIAITGAAAGRAIIDQPWLQGLAGLVDMLTSSSQPGQPSDPMKQISVNAQRALASGVVPAGVRLLARAFDPTSRTSDPGFEGFGQALAGAIPGLTDKAPARLGAFGQPIQRPGGSGPSVLNPFTPSPETNDPVEKELRRLQDGGYDVEPSLAGKRVTLIGEAIGLTPDQQRQYQTLSGVMTHDLLGSLLATDAYKSLPSDKQALVINRLGDRVADAARKTLYPTLLDQAVAKKVAELQSRQQNTRPGLAPEEYVTRRATGSADAPTGAAPTGSANITVNQEAAA